ncbi:MAG: nickel-dependent putative hexonate epimerase [Planctomycetota bacterium]|jgi:nickel-dependent lactate racemase
MLLHARGNEDDNLTGEDLQHGLHSALDRLGSKKKVLAIPPDFTRYHSRAGELTALTWRYYGEALTDVLPALGTHAPMTPSEIEQMFEGVPPEPFRKHNWRTDLVTLGEVPAEFVREVSEGRVDYGWPAQVNRLLVEGGFDLILSIGQVVPHEVSGMANYNKNIFIGTGGADGINKSHFLGAAYGMERIMGRADNPVRRVINYASDHFAKDMPIVYVLTVVSADKDGVLKTRGLFIGDDIECFNLAAELSLKVNLQMLDEPLQKVVVHLDPSEYKSTWLGNKSIYRTRMAMADGGELIVLAPGVSQFGEDAQIDRLIRKYGYVGTPGILDAVQKNDDLRENLSAAAHLIHGSPEGRFTITYCPGKLSRQEIEATNFGYAELEQMKSRYNPAQLAEGLNTLADGEEVFFISNPAIGLWAYQGRFGQD